MTTDTFHDNFGRRHVWRVELKPLSKSDDPDIRLVAADRCEVHSPFGLAFMVGDVVDSFFPFGCFNGVWRVSNGGEALHVRREKPKRPALP
jgi:hypothetical protein